MAEQKCIAIGMACKPNMVAFFDGKRDTARGCGKFRVADTQRVPIVAL
jgi:hypothetical protein